MRSPTSRPQWRLHAGRTVVTFTWLVDRWSHRISIPGGAADDAVAEWESVEGAGPAVDPCWPASPVLVELSRIAVRRAAAEASAIVGIGLAGRSHFSASIAPDPGAADAVRFEIACRLHEAPAWLGSTYRLGRRLFRLAAPVAVAPLPRTVVWAYSIGPQGIFGVSGATAAEHAD